MIDASLHRRGLERVSRRLFLRGTLSVGAFSLLTGCNLEDDDAVDRVLSAMSRWNDKVQAALFAGAFLTTPVTVTVSGNSTLNGSPCGWMVPAGPSRLQRTVSLPLPSLLMVAQTT